MSISQPRSHILLLFSLPSSSSSTSSSSSSFLFRRFPMETPGTIRRRQATISGPSGSEEVSSIEWEHISMTEQEEDLIHRMHRLVGEKWDLIAGRIPGRSAAEIERFWIMKQREGSTGRRRERRRAKSATFIK